MLRLTRELFVEEFGHRVGANVRALDVEQNKKHVIMNAIYDAIPSKEEWKILEGVAETAVKYLKDLTGINYGNDPALRTKDGVYFTVVPGVPMKVESHYEIPLWYYYSQIVGVGKSKEGRFRSNEVVYVIPGNTVKGPTLDDLQKDLANKAITHLMSSE